MRCGCVSMASLGLLAGRSCACHCASLPAAFEASGLVAAAAAEGGEGSVAGAVVFVCATRLCASRRSNSSNASEQSVRFVSGSLEQITREQRPPISQLALVLQLEPVEESNKPASVWRV
jgi:hypothetical protein